MTTTTMIAGNTYPHRQALAAMGGEWDAAAKAWRVPAARADEARRLVATVAKKQPYRPTRCAMCGCGQTMRTRILRNGLCGDCSGEEKEEREMGH